MPTLHWIGKEKVINHHLDVPFRVLDHQYGFDNGVQSTTETGSGNKIIHGDNLEALKALLPEYEGKIKCIYIDPPYNTGKSGWVYNDKVDHPKIKKWIGEVVGGEEEDLTTHDKWLCMMYPRMQLLKKMLRKDGLIFISIDDTEVGNLRLMCDEIFGQRNLITQFIWNSEGNTDNQFEIKINHEYILCYVLDINFKSQAIGRVIDPNTREDSNLWKGIVDNNINKNSPANPPDIIKLPVGFPCAEKELLYKAKILDEDFFQITKAEKYISDSVKEKYSIEPQSGLPVKLDDMIIQDFRLVKPCRIYGGFANRKKLEQFIKSGLKPISEKNIPMEFYLNRNAAVRYHKVNENPQNILSVLRNFGTTERMRTELKKIGIRFDYPKPVELIKFLLSIGASQKDSIILDSYAGSGTTGHAVLKLNQEDKGHRKFILIQLDEFDKNNNLVNLAEETTSQRIKNVIQENSFDESVGFDLYDIGTTLFNDNGDLNDAVPTGKIRNYIYYTETLKTLPGITNNECEYFLGKNEDTAYYFFYQSEAVCTLNHDFLAMMKTRAEQYVIYADNCLLTKDFMTKRGIIFKKIPRDITKF